jgi:bifunctional non-homologous end joining protein LigD
MKPMLAKTGDETYLSKTGYIYEPKLDGFRALLYFGKNPVFKSRNGKDLTERFPNISLPKIKASSCIIDGEIVAYDSKGNPDFSLLKNGTNDAVYVAFDIIKKNGVDLRHTPLLERKKILQSTLGENTTVQTIVYTEQGRKLWNAMKKRKLEGVIAKIKDSFYEDGKRSDSWLKIKLHNTVDAIIIGYTHSKRQISSLALGLYDDGTISDIGKVGTGFDDTFIESFLPRLKKMKTAKKFAQLPKEIITVRPRYVAEVEYQEITPDRKLRAPVFKRLRDDKKTSECRFPL